MTKRKAKKVLNIIGIVLAVLAATAFAVCYIVIPVQTKDFLNICVEYMNKPLPVVGVSGLIIAGIVWKIFISTSFGKKKYNELKAKYHAIEDSFKEAADIWEQDRKKLEEKIESLQEKLEKTNQFVIRVRDANPCKRVRNVKELEDEREETVDNETTSD